MSNDQILALFARTGVSNIVGSIWLRYYVTMGTCFIIRRLIIVCGHGTAGKLIIFSSARPRSKIGAVQIGPSGSGHSGLALLLNHLEPSMLALVAGTGNGVVYAAGSSSGFNL